MLSGLAEFVSLEDLKIQDDFEEEWSSFEENALGKARFYHELSGLPTIADDSGIFIETLEGELGVKTRRWGAGHTASDQAWLEYFMHRMENEKNRAAHFICSAAFVDNELEKAFLGETKGMITKNIEAPVQTGIPLSSVFKPNGSQKVFSALSTDEKNALSHRGKAFQKLGILLRDIRG